MALRVFLSSTLREYFPEYRPSEGVLFPLDERITVSKLCKRMNIPMKKVKIIMVNGKRESSGYLLRGDERVGLFPPIGGG